MGKKILFLFFSLFLLCSCGVPKDINDLVGEDEEAVVEEKGLAVEEGIIICERMEKETDRDKCFHNAATAENDKKYCEYIIEDELRRMCVEVNMEKVVAPDEALIKGVVENCGMFDNELEINKCISDFAVKSLIPGLCEEVTNSTGRVSVAECYMLMAIEHKDYLLCRKIVDDEANKNKCYQTAASSEKDGEYCDFVDDATARDICIDGSLGRSEEAVLEEELRYTLSVGNCELFDSEVKKTDCLIRLGVMQSSVNACESAGSNYMNDCKNGINNILETRNNFNNPRTEMSECGNEEQMSCAMMAAEIDPDICNNKDFDDYTKAVENWQLSCYENVTIKSGDYTYCDKIDGVSERSNCLKVFYYYNIPEICFKMGNEDKDNCLDYYATALNSGEVCDRIGDDVLQYDCFSKTVDAFRASSEAYSNKSCVKLAYIKEDYPNKSFDLIYDGDNYGGLVLWSSGDGMIRDESNVYFTKLDDRSVYIYTNGEKGMEMDQNKELRDMLSDEYKEAQKIKTKRTEMQLEMRMIDVLGEEKEKKFMKILIDGRETGIYGYDVENEQSLSGHFVFKFTYEKEEDYSQGITKRSNAIFFDGRIIEDALNPVLLDCDYEFSDTLEIVQEVESINEIITDSDMDGLSDDEEAKYGTDKNNHDTDGDGYTDGDEVKAGYNPKGDGVLLEVDPGDDKDGKENYSDENLENRPGDAKRISDVIQIQTALELQYNIDSNYPDADNFNEVIMGGYFPEVPKSPENLNPECDGFNDYMYSKSSGDESYKLRYCLEENSDSILSGVNIANSSGIANNENGEGYEWVTVGDGY